ncbi:hypothetical protein GCM10009554_76750 [Kribbella koreensis]|uniref:Uncharacterized protein n=2 Tax=Kribbella koreensis TaxID=57909 RepID=A0ABN1RP72_9ACTN
MPGAQAALQAMSDALAPLQAAFQKIAAGLEPMMKAIAKVGRAVDRLGLAVTPGLRAVVQCLYEAMLARLESVPGGRSVVLALRAAVDPILYPDLCRPGRPCTVPAVGTPPSRVTSPSRLVSRSTRSLRGPSAALDIPHQPWRAALA